MGKRQRIADLEAELDSVQEERDELHDLITERYIGDIRIEVEKLLKERDNEPYLGVECDSCDNKLSCPQCDDRFVALFNWVAELAHHMQENNPAGASFVPCYCASCKPITH